MAMPVQGQLLSLQHEEHKQGFSYSFFVVWCLFLKVLCKVLSALSQLDFSQLLYCRTECRYNSDSLTLSNQLVRGWALNNVVISNRKMKKIRKGQQSKKRDCLLVIVFFAFYKLCYFKTKCNYKNNSEGKEEMFCLFLPIKVCCVQYFLESGS